MKQIFSIFILEFLLFNTGFSQITINPSDIGSAGDTARYSHASLASPIAIEAGDTNYFWDFSNLIATRQSVKDNVSISSVPIVYKVAFYGKASFAMPEDDRSSSGFNLTDPYSFINKSSSVYEIVGFGGKMNGTPLPVVYNSADKIYKFPINYLNNDSSFSDWDASLPNTGYIGEILNRIDTVDAWGEIKTPYGQFSCLRIKSVVHKEDTVYMTSSGFGIRIPQDYTEYTWLAKGMNFPIMKATVSNGAVTQTNIVYMDSIRYFVGLENQISNKPTINIMPNPTNGIFRIDVKSKLPLRIQIVDIQGKIVYYSEENQSRTKIIDTKNWAKGMYMIQLVSENGYNVKKLIVQ